MISFKRQSLKLLLKTVYPLLRLYWFVTRPVTMGVRVLMIREGSILLVRHSYQGAWFLPGGGVKRGETLEQAIRREAREECGGQLFNLQLRGAFTHFYEYKNDHIVLFLSTEFEASGRGDGEIERVACFPLDDLPGDTSPGTRRRVEEFRQGKTLPWGDW